MQQNKTFQQSPSLLMCAMATFLARLFVFRFHRYSALWDLAEADAHEATSSPWPI